MHDEDSKQTVEVIASIIAERKLEQLSTDTAALTVANAAAMKAAAGAVTFDRAAAEQTDAIDAGELAAAIIDDAEAAATINNLHEEIQRLQRLLTTEQAAREAARIAADEAAATINYLEAENKRLQHLHREHGFCLVDAASNRGVERKKKFGPQFGPDVGRPASVWDHPG